MASLPSSITNAIEIDINTNRFTSSNSYYYWDSTLNMAFVLDRNPSHPLPYFYPLAYIIGFTNYSATAPWDSSGNLLLPGGITINNTNNSYTTSSGTNITIPNDYYEVKAILDPLNIGFDYSYYFPSLQSSYVLRSLNYFSRFVSASYNNLITINPASVTFDYAYLGDAVFKDNPTLQSINLGFSNVKYIGNSCFSGCSSLKLSTTTIASGVNAGLTYIPIFENIQTIGDNAFSGCSLLTSNANNTIVINATLNPLTDQPLREISYIGSFAFENTDVIHISIPNIFNRRVNSPVIASSAFSNCNNLLDFTCNKDIYNYDYFSNTYYVANTSNYFNSCFSNSNNITTITINGTAYDVNDRQYIYPLGMKVIYNNIKLFDGVIFISTLLSSIFSSGSVSNTELQDSILLSEFNGNIYKQNNTYSDYILTNIHNYYNPDSITSAGTYANNIINYSYDQTRPLYKPDGTQFYLNNSFDCYSNDFLLGTNFLIGTNYKFYDLTGIYCDLVISGRNLYYIDTGNILRQIYTDANNYSVTIENIDPSSNIPIIDTNFEANKGYQIEGFTPYVIPYSSNSSSKDTINFPIAAFETTAQALRPLIFQVGNTSGTTYQGNGFKNNTTIKHITFSEGMVDFFDKYYFMGCTALQTVVIPNLITTISEGLFQDCADLISITLPDTIGYIGKNAFKNCGELININLSNNLKIIGDYAFQGCSNLVKTTNSSDTLILPDSLIKIGISAFKDCTSLNKVKIGNNLKNLPDYSFQNCSSMTNIDFGNAVLTFGSHVFQGCSSLNTINLNNILGNVSNNSSLASIFGSNMFNGCSSLTSLSIPYGITSLPSNIFEGFSALQILNIPNTITSIPYQLFNWSPGIKRINSNIDGVLNLPDGIQRLGDNAFYGCNQFSTINLPNGLISIGDWCFCSCSNLQYLNFPKNSNVSLTIGRSAFEACNSLTSVDFTNVNISTISPFAFISCGNLSTIKFK